MAGPLKVEALPPSSAGWPRIRLPGDVWPHEVTWDAYRNVATVVAGKVRLWSRNAIEWTRKVPELADAIASIKRKSAQLDGEMSCARSVEISQTELVLGP